MAARKIVADDTDGSGEPIYSTRIGSRTQSRRKEQEWRECNNVREGYKLFQQLPSGKKATCLAFPHLPLKWNGAIESGLLLT